MKSFPSVSRYPSVRSSLVLPLCAAVFTLALAGCGRDDEKKTADSGSDPADSGNQTAVAPQVTATNPPNDSVGVAINAQIAATFSEEIEALSLTSTSFTVTHEGNALAGVIAYGAGNIVTFTPAAALPANALITATLRTDIKDAQGTALATDYVWSFTTGATADLLAPELIGNTPATDAVSVAINTQVTATFSEAMDPVSINAQTFTVTQGTTAIAGTVQYGLGNTATFTATSSLPTNTTLVATVSNQVKDVRGNPMANPFTWSFTTADAVDTQAPEVTQTDPVAGAMNVATNTKVSATFSEAMDPSTISSATFTVKQGATVIPGTVSYGPGFTARFTANAALPSGVMLTATVNGQVKDRQGNAMGSDTSWTFSTGTVAALGPAPVGLGAAGNYVILAKTAVSSVPDSAVTGDIGVSPAAASFITGFSLVAHSTNVYATSTQVTGQVKAADYAVPTPTNLTTAVSNMEAAYTDAAGRTTPDFLELGTGNIGGKTLAPGLYKWTSTVTIPENTTISGAANDVWIFQTSGDLSMSAAKKITLAGGAQAKNIFWQVAGKATFGAGAEFEGILLCKTQVTLETGAKMNGRILSQSQVAIQKAVVTKP